MKIVFDVPLFNDRIIPRGFLPADMGAQALYYYSIMARRMQERTSNDPNLQAIIYEGMPSENVNYRELFKSVAKMYGVTPERMEKFWQYVDMQLLMEGCPKLEGPPRFEWTITTKP